MNYDEILVNARSNIGKYCKCCPVCNGIACRNQIPGPGAKGVGDVAILNYAAWNKVRIVMDVISENKDIDTSVTLFNQQFKYPFFAGPVGAVNLHYGDCYNDATYNDIMMKACKDSGIAAFSGDGTNPEVMIAATKAIKENNGIGIATIKPWNLETIQEKMKLVEEANGFAVAMDIDAAGLPFLKNMTPPAGRKSVAELKKVIQSSKVPFVVKGIMSVNSALKALEAGADAIVVSNHGGRVLDGCNATADVLMDIVDAVDGRMKVFVDGGLRSGVDVFKALAMGADGILICRPFVCALYGDGANGVATYIEKIGSELQDTMSMCGANSIEEITREMIIIKGWGNI